MGGGGIARIAPAAKPELMLELEVFELISELELSGLRVNSRRCPGAAVARMRQLFKAGVCDGNNALFPNSACLDGASLNSPELPGSNLPGIILCMLNS